MGRCIGSWIRGVAAGIGLLGMVVASATQSDVTWSGGGATPEWNVADNWAGGVAPDVTTAGRILYRTDGQGVTGTVEANRTVGGVNADNSISSAIVHAIDLDGNVLAVSGNWVQNTGDSTLSVTNGTLQFGVGGSPVTIELGKTTAYYTRSLIVRPGTILRPYLDKIQMGQGSGHQGPGTRLDLRGVVLDAAFGGVLSVNEIHARSGMRGHAYIYMDDTTQIATLKVLDDFLIEWFARDNTTRIGNPSDGWKLPAGMHVHVGDQAEDHRGNLRIGRDARGSVSGWLILNGGDLIGWMNNLDVGYDGSADGGGNAHGRLDLRNVGTNAIDTLTLTVGTTHGAGYDGRGQLWLGGGTVQARDVTLGNRPWTSVRPVNDTGWANVLVSNTVFTVTNSLWVGKSATIRIDVLDSSSGIDLTEGVDFTWHIAEGNSLDVHFHAAPATEDFLYALKLKGDRIDELAAITAAGELTASNHVGSAWKTGAFYSNAVDTTYFALVDADFEFPPVFEVQDATFEVETNGTVWVDISEVVTAAEDFEGRPFTLGMSYGAQDNVTNLSLSGGPGSYPVDAIMTIEDVPDAIAYTNAVTITLEPIVTATNDIDVTWDGGGAATVLMPRPEWFWSGNWEGGVPPASNTTGRILYGVLGQSVTGVLEQDRTVGGLRAEGDISHIIDLGGNRLVVEGNWFQNSASWNAQNMTVGDGILQIGTPADPVTMDLTFNNGNCTLTIQTNVTFSPYIDRLRSAQGDSSHNGGGGRLDLRGVQLGAEFGGEWGLDVLDLRVGRRGAAWIAFNDDSAIDTWRVLDEFSLAVSSRGSSVRLGNPDDGWKLPADMSMHIGDEATSRRALLQIGRDAQPSEATDSRLILNSGDFIAYLSALRVGHTSGSTGTTGLLDLGNAGLLSIDTPVFQVGAGLGSGGNGTVILDAGDVLTGDVTVGGNSTGSLTLNGTRFIATNTVSVGANGTVTVNLSGEAGGLDLSNADTGALDLAAGGMLTVTFSAPSQTSDLYTGLKWAGYHVATLEAWRDADPAQLVINDGGLLQRPAAIYHIGGYTYVGEPPPPGSLFLLR